MLQLIHYFIVVYYSSTLHKNVVLIAYSIGNSVGAFIVKLFVFYPPII